MTRRPLAGIVVLLLLLHSPPTAARQRRKAPPAKPKKKATTTAATTPGPGCDELTAGALCTMPPFKSEAVCTSCTRRHTSPGLQDATQGARRIGYALAGKERGDDDAILSQLLPVINMPAKALRKACRRSEVEEWVVFWSFAEACTHWLVQGGGGDGAAAIGAQCAGIWQQAFETSAESQLEEDDLRHWTLVMTDGQEQLRIFCSMRGWDSCAPQAHEAGERLPPVPTPNGQFPASKIPELSPPERCDIRVVREPPDEQTWQEILDSKQPVLLRGFDVAGINAADWNSFDWTSDTLSDTYHTRRAQITVRMAMNAHRHAIDPECHHHDCPELGEYENQLTYMPKMARYHIDMDSKTHAMRHSLLAGYVPPPIFAYNTTSMEHNGLLHACNTPDIQLPSRWVITAAAGSTTSFHIDPINTSAWNTLLQGRKRWIFFPPSVRVPPGLDAFEGLEQEGHGLLSHLLTPEQQRAGDPIDYYHRVDKLEDSERFPGDGSSWGNTQPWSVSAGFDLTRYMAKVLPALPAGAPKASECTMVAGDTCALPAKQPACALMPVL
jgi:hypothetical protein